MALMALPPPRLPGAGLVLRQASIQHSTLSCAGRRLQRNWPRGKPHAPVCFRSCARARTPADHLCSGAGALALASGRTQELKDRRAPFRDGAISNVIP